MSDKLTVRKKYNLINAFRLIASFFVIAIHVHFPGTAGNIVIDAARFAVPFFFMASGFFSFYSAGTDVPKKILNKIKNVLIPFMGAVVIYFAYHSFDEGVGVVAKRIFFVKIIARIFCIQ